MRLEDMEYFTEIVRCKSLNMAANALYISQPALGAAIKNFENELGVPLLYRSPNGVRPTLIGKRVYRDCSVLLQEFHRSYAAWQAYIRSFRSARGNVQISTFPLLSPFLASSFAKELNDLCPDISLSVWDCPLRHNLQKFFENDLRIAVGVLEKDRNGDFQQLFTAAEEHQLEVTILARDQLKVCIAKKNPLANQKSLSLSDLESLNLITYFPDEREVAYVPFPCKRILYAHTPDQMLQMVQENLGIFLAGEKIARHHSSVQNGLIKIMDIQDFQYPPMYIYMVHLPEAQLSSAEAVVVQALYDCFFDDSADNFLREREPGETIAAARGSGRPGPCSPTGHASNPR